MYQAERTRPLWARIYMLGILTRRVARLSDGCQFAVTQFRSFSFGTMAVLSKPPHPFTELCPSYRLRIPSLEDSLPTVGIGCYYTIVCATVTGNRKKCHSWFVSAFRTVISSSGTRNERAGSPFYYVERGRWGYGVGEKAVFLMRRISRGSILVKPKHLPPRSFNEAPMRYSSLSSMMRKRSWNSSL